MVRANRSVKSARNGGRRHSLRPVYDALAAFVVLLAVGLTCDAPSSAAHPMFGGLQPPPSEFAVALSDTADRPIVEIATTNSSYSPDAVYRRTSATAAWVLLSLAFSVVAAFNLAFFRHMRRAYRPSRTRNE